MVEHGRDFAEQLAGLRRLRDELRLEAHLARAEARARWQRLEARWPELEARLEELERATGAAAATVGQAARALLDELGEGYRGLKRER
jgi:hypothetical protein